jgi:hypothetical protein
MMANRPKVVAFREWLLSELRQPPAKRKRGKTRSKR